MGLRVPKCGFEEFGRYSRNVDIFSENKKRLGHFLRVILETGGQIWPTQDLGESQKHHSLQNESDSCHRMGLWVLKCVFEKFARCLRYSDIFYKYWHVFGISYMRFWMLKPQKQPKVPLFQISTRCCLETLKNSLYQNEIIKLPVKSCSCNIKSSVGQEVQH